MKYGGKDQGVGSIHFDIDSVAVAPSQREILIVCQMQLGDRRVYCADRLILNEEGLVSRGMGLYGPPV